MIKLMKALAAIAVSLSVTGAPAYGEKPTRLVVPFAAGGPTDLIARIVAQGLTQRLGGRYVVENVGGAAGNIALAQVARSKPDGTTFVVVGTGFLVNPSLFKNVPYDPKRDFEPVTIAAATPNVLTVHPDVAAETLEDLVKLIKKSPKKYSYSMPGYGSTPHLSGELMRSHFGLDIEAVPFSGAAPAVTSTIGGHTQLAWTSLPSVVEAVKGGKLRAIAVTSKRRVPLLPDVPTLDELGVHGQEAETITAFLAPAGTGPEPIARLHREISAIVNEPESRRRLSELGFEPLANTPEEFAKLIDQDLAKWRNVIERSGISRIE